MVGLRPYRASGLVIRSETAGGKTVIRNYGHGGGGVSLSWGAARLAVEEALLSGQRNFAVIGCGCVGLATARLLQHRGFMVTMYAKDLPPYTTPNATQLQVIDELLVPVFQGHTLLVRNKIEFLWKSMVAQNH